MVRDVSHQPSWSTREAPSRPVAVPAAAGSVHLGQGRLGNDSHEGVLVITRTGDNSDGRLGRQVVRKAIPSEQACDKLIELIKENFWKSLFKCLVK